LTQGCAAHGGGGGCASPRSENFQFYPAKIAYFIEKKDRKIKKKCLAPPTFEKIMYGPSEF